MTRVRDAALDVLLVAASITAAWLLCWQPYRCNVARGSVKASTEDAYIKGRGEIQAKMAARSNLAILRGCEPWTCRTVSGLMLVAANQQVLEDYDGAAASYRAALELDRRPELYLNLGNALAHAGDRAAAERSLQQAVLFNPWMMPNIEDGELRQRAFEYLLRVRPASAEMYKYIYSLPPDAV